MGLNKAGFSQANALSSAAAVGGRLRRMVSAEAITSAHIFQAAALIRGLLWHLRRGGTWTPATTQ